MIKISRLIKSFQYAFRGLFKVFSEEQNLKVHLLITLIVLFLSIIFNISRFEWIVLILVISLVFLMEIINSALERIADVLKPRIDSYVKEIKDIAAAAVLLASLVAILTGLLIFYPYIFNIVYKYFIQ